MKSVRFIHTKMSETDFFYHCFCYGLNTCKILLYGSNNFFSFVSDFLRNSPKQNIYIVTITFDSDLTTILIRVSTIFLSIKYVSIIKQDSCY